MLSRILIVDPDQDCHELIGRIIGQGVSGPVVHLDHAYNGQGGYRLVDKARANHQPYDRVFVASQLPPGWDGLETIRRIWETGGSENLILMGGGRPLSELEALRCAYLEKPLEEKAILNLLMNEEKNAIQSFSGVQDLPPQVEESKIGEDTGQVLKAMAAMNHDLDQALDNLSSQLKLLAASSLNSEQTRLVEQLGQTQALARKLNGTVRGMTQLEMGQAPEPRIFSFTLMISNLKNHLLQEGVDLEASYQLSPNFIDEVKCDEEHLKQALEALVHAARRNGAKEPLVISEYQAPHGDHCLFKIQDPHEKQAGEEITTRLRLSQWKGEGTHPPWDLLLAVRLIRSMEGRLWVESSRDGGVTYCISAPLQQIQPPCFSTCPIIKKQILLVEDNPTNIKIVKLHLSNAGFEVSVAENGGDAVEKALSQSFDLILMDLQMPDIDGFTITRMIREELGDQVPIIALTANVFGDHRVQSFEAGMVDFIAKPIRRGPFIKRIEKWIGPAKAPALAEAETPLFGKEPLDPCACNGMDRVLDYERLLYEFQGDRDLVKNVVKEFVLNTENQLKAILSALMGNNLKTAVHQAHSLKGGGANLCAMPFANAAAELEDACEQKDANRISGALMKLNREFKCLTEVIKFNEHLSL